MTYDSCAVLVGWFRIKKYNWGVFVCKACIFWCIVSPVKNFPSIQCFSFSKPLILGHGGLKPIPACNLGEHGCMLDTMQTQKQMQCMSLDCTRKPYANVSICNFITNTE